MAVSSHTQRLGNPLVGIGREQVAVGALALALSAAFLAAALSVRGDRVLQADIDVGQWIQGIDVFGWHTALDISEVLTGAPLGVIIWAVLAAGFWAAGRPVEALIMGAAPLIWLPKLGIQEIVASPRPTVEFLQITEIDTGSGFPSGHMTGSITIYGMLAVIAFQQMAPGRCRTLVVGGIVAMLTLASFSRVDSGAHWPSDVLGSLLLGGVWLMGLIWAYGRMRRDQVPLPGLSLVRRLRSTPAPDSADGLRTAGSIASTVYLDDKAGTASKIYRPPRLVRWLYWAALQASFPYAAREEALRTAAAVRELSGRLTEYWTGRNMVAAVREIRCERGEFVFVTDLVPGEEPRDNAEIGDVLQVLRRRFAEAGLPTWQIDPNNPHAHTNFIRTPEGNLFIIDLESTLIPLIQPLNMLPRMLRMGRMPTFDDVDYERLEDYIALHEADLREALGAPGLAALHAAVDEARECARVWKSGEPNIWGRMAHRVWGWIGWDRRTAPIRRRLANSEEFARRFLMKPLDRWVAEGRISAEAAESIREGLQSDSAHKVLRFLGVHVIISIPLRFPFGSLARFAGVVGMRIRASVRYGRGEMTREAFEEARRTHTWYVAVIALVPGFGAGAYLVSPQMRECSFLIPLAVDRVLHRIPFRVCYRWRLHRLTVGRLDVTPPGTEGSRNGFRPRRGRGRRDRTGTLLRGRRGPMPATPCCSSGGILVSEGRSGRERLLGQRAAPMTMLAAPPPAILRKPVIWTGWLGLLVVTLTILAALADRFPGDRMLTGWIQSPASSTLDTISRGIGGIGVFPHFLVAGVILAAICWCARHRVAAAFVLLAAAAQVGALLVKAVVERSRPPDDLVRVIGTHDGFSFPSGHVFGTVLLWGFVAYVATTQIRHPLLRRTLQGTSLAVIASTAVQRVYAGAHWPSDALGGILWGTLVLALIIAAFEWRRARV